MDFKKPHPTTRRNLTNSAHPFEPYLHYLLLGQNIFCLISTDLKHFTRNFFVDKELWARFVLLSKIDLPNKLPVVVDGLQFSGNSLFWTVQFNLTNFLRDDRLVIYTLIDTKKLSLISTTSIYKSCIWLERELSDFTNMQFIGSVDTRRLLLDYFEPKSA